MSSAAESFLYIWYDTKNKMFYLGKHKGTPDDSYTHSSTIMESFNKDNIPSYMKRRILAYGTDEEMCLLEHECLKNRKEKKWDRYYNQSLGSPWLDQSGENNPFYKHGRSGTPEYHRDWWRSRGKDLQKKWREENREYYNEQKRKYYAENREHFREYKREWYAGRAEQERERAKKYRQENYEHVLAKERAYAETHRERRRETDKEYRERNRENLREYQREYRAKNKDKIKEQQRLSYQKNKEKRNEQARIRRAKKKAERLASGATLPI